MILPTPPPIVFRRRHYTVSSRRCFDFHYLITIPLHFTIRHFSLRYAMFIADAALLMPR